MNLGNTNFNPNFDEGQRDECYKNFYAAQREYLETNAQAKNDSYVMGSLLRCGVDLPIIFSLMWGDDLSNNKLFPRRLREIVTDIIQEEEKRDDSSDSFEIKVHNIAIELLWFLYEREVNEISDRVIKSKCR